MPTTRAPITPTARTKPPSRAARIASRLALGAVLILNALCLLCWPAVVELIGSNL